MKSPFEDTRLRQQTLKLIEFQRQGKFLALPNEPEQDAPPIPTIKELGLRRARYPYDYEADWGPSEQPFMTVNLTFEDLDGKTRYPARVLHWTAEACEQHEQMGFHQGWGQCADQLAVLLPRM